MPLPQWVVLMMFRNQPWLAFAIALSGSASVALPRLSAQDALGRPSSSAAPDAVNPADTDVTEHKMLLRVHLPGSQIADVFRAQSQAAVPLAQGVVPPEPDGEAAAGGTESLTDSNVTQAEMAQWIDQLGWSGFADREQATGRLRSLGKQALPVLRKATQEHPDVEVRMRASDVAAGIDGSETAGRVDAFLAGKAGSMEGWDVASKILGDGVRVRELFVEIYLRHEAAAAALEGSTKQRAKAFRSTLIEIQRGMYVEHRSPTEADLVALLLLANDQDMPVSAVEEDALLDMMRRDAKTRLLIDAQLSGVFRALLSGWFSRPDLTNSEKLMWFALDCELEDALPLALETLQKSTDPPALAISMQAIARFGDKTNINDVAKYLDDERAATEVQYFGGNVIQPQLRDAAMATIVLLSERKLAEFAMDDNAIHAKVGFIVQGIGFPAENNELRLQAIEKVKKELVPEK